MMQSLASRILALRPAVGRSVVAVHGVRAMATAAGAGEYDVVIVGGGPGGYVAAIKAGQLGLRTACVESRGALGGTCLNVGCIPSKALLHASHMYHEAKHGMADLGINIEGTVSMDLEKMMSTKDKTVKGLTGGIAGLLKKNKVDYIKGYGTLTGSNSVSVKGVDGQEDVTLSTKNVVIATGSVPSPLPSAPVDNEAGLVVDSTGALMLKKVPEHLVVVGGGVIGLEMGSVWGRLGSKVTVIEFLDKIIPGTDLEIVKEFQKNLKKQGFKFKLSTKVVNTEVTADGVKVTVEPSAGGEQTTIDASVVLVSTGRRPFTDGLGLDTVGVTMDKMGRVEVDEHFRTNVPSVWAIGDVIRGPMLAHKAEEEGIACVETISGLSGHVNYDAIPGVIYTHPEVATVGKTEEQLKEEGIAYSKGTFPMKANSRARAVQDDAGIVKILADKETDRILGIHIVGPNAGEMIAEGVLAMEYGASSEDIARTCHAHPTMAEAFKEAAMATYNKPIHF